MANKEPTIIHNIEVKDVTPPPTVVNVRATVLDSPSPVPPIDPNFYARASAEVKAIPLPCYHEAGHALLHAMSGDRVNCVEVKADGIAFDGREDGRGYVSPDDDLHLWFLFERYVPSEDAEEKAIALKCARLAGLSIIAGPMAGGLFPHDSPFRWQDWRAALADIRRSEPDRAADELTRIEEGSAEWQNVVGNTGDVETLLEIAALFDGNEDGALLWEYWAGKVWEVLHCADAARCLLDTASALARDAYLSGDEVNALCEGAGACAKDWPERVIEYDDAT